MSLKNKIRNNFLGAYCISLLHCAESALVPKIIDDKQAVLRDYKKRSGKNLNLDNPTTFSEKNNWYKLNDHNSLMEQCADKIEVRSYVESKGYRDALNELICVYDKVQNIDYSMLPNRFVMKAAHGSHMNYIVENKSQFNYKQANIMMKTWLHQNIYWSRREWVYKNLKKRIVVEKYLEDQTGGLSDYKFFCFNGKPAFLQFNSNRFSKDIVQNFYDLEWNLLPFGKSIPHNPNVNIQKPKAFEEMIEMATVLCEPFQFVRVDLYEVNSKVYFGEMTFYPAGGTPDFIPKEYDEIVGKMWEIKK